MFTVPLVVRSPYGGGIFGGQTHSQSPESLFTHIAGLKVAIPSNPYDAKGLLIAAIEDDDPVIVFEPKRIYNGPFDGWHEKPVSPWAGHPKAEVPEERYVVPLGKADIVRGAELSALVQERCIHHLEAPVLRVTGWDTPYPHAFEWDYFPGPARLAEALKKTMAEV